MRAELQLVLTLRHEELSDPSRMAIALFNQVAPLVGRPPLPEMPGDSGFAWLIGDAQQAERLRCLELVEKALEQMARYDVAVRQPLMDAAQHIRDGHQP